MEIIAGLHMSSIQRLKKTWKALSSKYTAIFEEITKFIATEGNYRNYRSALSKAELPINPYLGTFPLFIYFYCIFYIMFFFIIFFSYALIGVFLRDLTFIEDGNPDFVEDDQFMNFEKMRMLNGVLAAISRYQSMPYGFEPVPIIQEYIISGTNVNLSDASLHKYSLLWYASCSSLRLLFLYFYFI